jgi:hypothetical protein
MLDKKFMPSSFHEFALQDMAHSNGERFALCCHEPGRKESAWLYFPSCQLCSTSPGEVLASYRFLRERLPGGVGIMLRCCGAPAFWAGRDDLFRESIESVRMEWELMGRPLAITACSTCQNLFLGNIPEMATQTLWKTMEDIGLPNEGALLAHGRERRTVSVVDPCITRHDQETQESVRRIAQSLGFAIEELSLSREKPECCGYGGLMYNADPLLARDLIAHRTTKMDKPDTTYYRTTVNDNDYLAYCAMCRDNLAAAGKRTAHLIEHLFPSIAGGDPAARGWISWSERRTNRVRVKESILQELAGKGGGIMEEIEKIALRMDPEVRRRIDERRILEDDIRRVIDHAELSGKRLQNSRTGHFLAYLQSENVTFWVEYSAGDSMFTVYNAYCHRMKITGIKQ